MSCEDKVPWLYGKPDRLIKLDDKQQLHENNLQLDTGLRRGDYYIHFNSCKWYVVERKEGKLRFEHKISQIKSTVEQLLHNNSRKVDGCVIVADKIHPNEKNLYGVDKRNKEIYLRNSVNRKKVEIYGMTVLFYTICEVNTLRGDQ